MSDFLLDLGKNPRARRVIQSLGLPIPLPQSLRRASGPLQFEHLRGELELHEVERQALDRLLRRRVLDAVRLERVDVAFVGDGAAVDRAVDHDRLVAYQLTGFCAG